MSPTAYAEVESEIRANQDLLATQLLPAVARLTESLGYLQNLLHQACKEDRAAYRRFVGAVEGVLTNPEDYQ